MKTNKEFLEGLLKTYKNNLNFISDLSNYLTSPFSLISSSKSDFNHETKTEIVESFVKNVPNLKDEQNTMLYLNKALRLKNIKKFRNNDYIKLLNQHTISNLNYKTIKPYEIFIAGNSYLQFDDNKYFIPLGYFEDEFKYPTFSNYSIDPHYIESVDLPLKIVKGKILILGLKLGYFAYMSSLKEDVKDVYVVESNKDLINMFETNVLSTHKNKIKVHIFNQNPFEFIDTIKDEEFNYIFVDLWNEDCKDVSSYIDAKSRLDKVLYTRVIYYFEESIVTELGTRVTNALLNPGSNELSKALTNYKFVNIYDYRKLFTVKSLLDLFKK